MFLDISLPGSSNDGCQRVEILNSTFQLNPTAAVVWTACFHLLDHLRRNGITEGLLRSSTDEDAFQQLRGLS